MAEKPAEDACLLRNLRISVKLRSRFIQTVRSLSLDCFCGSYSVELLSRLRIFSSFRHFSLFPCGLRTCAVQCPLIGLESGLVASISPIEQRLISLKTLRSGFHRTVRPSSVRGSAFLPHRKGLRSDRSHSGQVLCVVLTAQRLHVVHIEIRGLGLVRDSGSDEDLVLCCVGKVESCLDRP